MAKARKKPRRQAPAEPVWWDVSDVVLVAAMIVAAVWSFENPAVSPALQGVVVVLTPVLAVALIRTRLDDWLRR